jgi:hypothetical protein
MAAIGGTRQRGACQVNKVADYDARRRTAPRLVGARKTVTLLLRKTRYPQIPLHFRFTASMWNARATIHRFGRDLESGSVASVGKRSPNELIALSGLRRVLRAASSRRRCVQQASDC